MLGQEQDNDQPSAGDGGGASRKLYLRSVSWTDRSPRTPSPRPKSNTKSRLCLPPLQPLSISRRSFEEWPRAGSDDLGIWPQAPTPGARGSIAEAQNPDSEQPEREFEFKKDKLAFFDKECSRITDHIYLGSDAVAKNREILRENGITHVLNCVGFVCPEYFKNELVYKTLWLHDSPSEDITSILYDVFDYFEDVQKQNGRVLVHCCQGVSRSNTLVIAYLMWRKKQTFEDAFQYVKAARGVTNPNMGFACQLLLCQNRTLAFLASPNSVLRMYRMAPHSAYDPLHLVPKMLSQTGVEGLDSRGAFIVHVPSAVYVWIGKYCASVMSDVARAAAFQVIKYEMAQGPVVTIREGEEPSEFWESLVNQEISADGCPFDGKRKVDLYDMDFEMFHKALSGGVVPPFPLSGTRSETCLPARENGWGIVRKNFARGNLKELIKASKLTRDTSTSSHGSDYPDSPLPSSCKSGSPDVFFCSPTGSPNRREVYCKDVEDSDPLTSPSSSPTPSCSYSFSSFLEHSPKFGPKSPSLSPSTTDFSSSFTFSPSSSNWSDLSYISSQSSPSGLESPNLYLANDASLAENVCLLCKGTSHSLEKASCGNHALPRESNACFPCKGSTLSIAERRGSNPPPRMMLPSVDETSQVPHQLTRSYSFSLLESVDSVMRDVECNESEKEGFSDAEMLDSESNLIFHTKNTGESDAFDLPSSDTKSCVTETKVTNLVLYQWPTMDKVEMHLFQILDSTSVYITFVSDGSSGDVLYIWLGRQFSSGEGQNQLTTTSEGRESSHTQWETVGCNFLKRMGLPQNSFVQVVREGEEPEQLLKHLNCFSFYKT